MIHSPIQGISRTRNASRLRFPASRTDPAQRIRAVLRRVHRHVCGAFSLALDRTRAALGQWVQIRRVKAVEASAHVPLVPMVRKAHGQTNAGSTRWYRRPAASMPPEAQTSGTNEPRPLPAQVLDHATGYLMSFAALSVLARRAVRGGSWHVRVSPAQTGYWLRQLGCINDLACHDLSFDDVSDRLEDTQSRSVRLTAVRHAAVMTETPPHWAPPTVPLGTHAPAWPRPARLPDQRGAVVCAPACRSGCSNANASICIQASKIRRAVG